MAGRWVEALGTEERQFPLRRCQIVEWYRGTAGRGSLSLATTRGAIKRGLRIERPSVRVAAGARDR